MVRMMLVEPAELSVSFTLTVLGKLSCDGLCYLRLWSEFFIVLYFVVVEYFCF